MVQVTQPGIQNIGYKYFIIYAVLNFVWFWVTFRKFISVFSSSTITSFSSSSVSHICPNYGAQIHRGEIAGECYKNPAHTDNHSPCKTVFYPETARKTLEELDYIFKPAQEFEDRPISALQTVLADKEVENRVTAAPHHVETV